LVFLIKKLVLFCLLALFVSVTLYAQDVSVSSAKNGRVIIIDSYYYPIYDWAAGEVAGVRSVLEPAGVKIKVLSMDTKRHPEEAYIKAAALKVKAEIERWQPDVIIAFDDNASKYLIQPYYKDSSIPVVFGGINWDASVYGYPYKNATGMVEISMITELVNELGRYAKGDKLGVLAGNVITDRKNVLNFEKKAGIKFNHKVFVANAEQWKKAYLKLQDEVDFLIIENSMSIVGWKPEEMHKFIMGHTRIPTGAVLTIMQPYVLIGFFEVPEEQGQYAAKTALRILAGESPHNIPLVTNHQVTASVNLDLADKQGIIFELEFLRNAKSFRWNTVRQ